MRLASEGCDVALLARNRKGLETVAERVRADGRAALVLPADVTDRDGVAGAMARVRGAPRRARRAGLQPRGGVFGRFDQVGPEDFDRTVDVTFTGAVNVIRACMPALCAARWARSSPSARS